MQIERPSGLERPVDGPKDAQKVVVVDVLGEIESERGIKAIRVPRAEGDDVRAVKGRVGGPACVSPALRRAHKGLGEIDTDILADAGTEADTSEALFVKNLENVQGDERDIILISTVYGPTAEGVFHQNFGPINKAYGHRRLNVLFTRAKRKLVLFTSLDHTQIIAEGKQRGVRVLKEYLEYAATGSFQIGRRLGQEPDSDFERWFLDRLNHAGYQAHPQVGVAKYRVDIGVIHPDRAGNYIIGIECDGATYHSSKSARDRDRLRQDVLESLNWQIHRVWSTDWYRDPEREFGRLVRRIESLRTIKS
jgi:very-short-patch-repair endonuclease